MKFISSTNDVRKYLGLQSRKNIKFKNISIDTRTIKKDSLFIALKGPNFDGNKFIEKAFLSGRKPFYVQINLIKKELMLSMFQV